MGDASDRPLSRLVDRASVFDRPVRLWAAGVTGESTRDNPQRVLVGPPQQQEMGHRHDPGRRADADHAARAARDVLDSVVVRWGGGGDVQQGESVLSFKSYEKGREKWQGETLRRRLVRRGAAARHLHPKA